MRIKIKSDFCLTDPMTQQMVVLVAILRFVSMMIVVVIVVASKTVLGPHLLTSLFYQSTNEG